MDASYHLWIIPLLPLIGSAINGILGRRLKFSNATVSAIGVGSVALACAWAFATVVRFPWPAAEGPHIERVFTWIAAGAFRIDYALYLDPLSAVMMLVVTGVGLLIHIYSIGYMGHEGGYYRFFSYMNLFMFFMLTLVMANNYLLMFVGWEGVGLCSYLLIGFYFLRKSAADAGKKAFIVNRVGDFGFTMGIITLFWLVSNLAGSGSLDFDKVFSTIAGLQPETAGAGVLTVICLLLLLGAAGKSAQIPLYVWLPDAMEGPTPVSALIHAATMVTAGVYMVARSHALFERAPMALFAVAIVGAATAIFAATIGMVQNDIKKVLAYSTISQLGYMFLACGVTAFGAGIFHLMTHAFFKALLFLGAGSVIHAMSNEQDMRKMGGLKHHIPYTYWTFFAACLAIAGIFPFAGFFSKDEILWRASGFMPGGNWLFWLIGSITAGMTAFYVFRAFFLTFHGRPRSPEAEHAHESPPVMTVPLVILAILSIVGGWIGWPHALGGHNRFEKFLAPVFEPHAAAVTAAHEVSASTEIAFSVIAVCVGLFGIFMAWLIYVARPELSQRAAQALARLHRFVYNKYYVDEAYNVLFVRPIVVGSTKLLWQAFDVGVIDGTVNGIATTARNIGGELRRMQSGNIRSYASWVLIGAVCVISFMSFLWAR